MSRTVQYPRRNSTKLDGIWDFAFSETADYRHPELNAIKFTDKITVPGVWDAMPAWNGKRGIGFYRTNVTIPCGKRARLHIGTLGLYGKVFVDGKMLGEHNSPYVPFDVIIPPGTTEQRELIVMIGNRFDYELCPLFELFFDFYAYGGIYRDVELQILPEEGELDWIGIDTIDWTSGKIQVKVTAAAVGPRQITIKDEKNQILSQEERRFATPTETFDITLPQAAPWSPEAPNLHWLTVDTGTDAIRVRFGIRQVSAKQGQIYINGQQISKLRGYCRHEAHPQFGPALPEAQLLADIQLLRDLGCNFVRGSHYPQDPRFLALCDEYGILVWEEGLGWGQQLKQFTDPNFITAQVKHLQAMCKASYNNPSIILRGFLNEGNTTLPEAEYCYSTLVTTLRESDPNRLVTYASNQYMKDRYLEMADVVSFNTYPGWYSQNPEDEYPIEEIVPCLRGYVDALKERGLGDKPLIISEIGASGLYGWDDPMKTYWSESYQAECLQTAVREIMTNPAICGVALWQFCDARTYRGSRALGRPRGFNNKGTMDEYRRPKAAYQAVKAAFTQKN